MNINWHFFLILLHFGLVWNLPHWNALQAPYTECGNTTKMTGLDTLQMATDSSGNVWHFDGRDHDCTWPIQLRYFDIQQNQWQVKWSSESGIPGPSQKTYDATLWIDKDDNLWIYGGADTGLNGLCQFWLFNKTTEEWISYLPGDTSINYGEMEVPSDTTFPGCRRGMAIWYTSDDNSLWMAFGITPSWMSSYQTPAMWRFSIDSKQWSWYSGPNVTLEENLVANNQTSFDNSPRGRWAPFSAVDEDYNFWLFGGEASNGNMNDLWMFNRSSGWKRLGGSDIPLDESTPTWGTLGKFSEDAWPPLAKYGSLVYAGNGLLAMTVSNGNFLDTGYATDQDWYYDIYSNQWACTYNASVEEPPVVANVLNTPDESTRPGTIYYSRVITSGRIWAIGAESKAVLVKDLSNGDFLCELEPICSLNASCTGSSCVCNQGFEGTGRGPYGCSELPPTPTSTPDTSAPVFLTTPEKSPSLQFSSGIKFSLEQGLAAIWIVLVLY